MASIHSKRLVTVLLTLAGIMALVLGTTADAFAASLVRTVSTDPYTNSTSAHATQLEPDTFSFGSTTVAAFQSGRFFDGGASNICFALTKNNGGSWSHGCLPDTTVFATQQTITLGGSQLGSAQTATLQILEDDGIPL